MRKIILPLIAMVVLTGCSPTTKELNIDLAFKCIELYKKRVALDENFYSIDVVSDSLLGDHQIWYDEKYGSCIYAFKMKGDYYDPDTQEQSLGDYEEYWDLVTDTPLTYQTYFGGMRPVEFDKEIKELFSNSKF